MSLIQLASKMKIELGSPHWWTAAQIWKTVITLHKPLYYADGDSDHAINWERKQNYRKEPWMRRQTQRQGCHSSDLPRNPKINRPKVERNGQLGRRIRVLIIGWIAVQWEYRHVANPATVGSCSSIRWTTAFYSNSLTTSRKRFNISLVFLLR